MPNLIAFFLTTTVLLSAVFWVGLTIGAERQRERRRAIDAANHAHACRVAAKRVSPRDRDVVLDMLRRTPGFSIETEEGYSSDIVRVRGKNQRAYVILEFTKANGTLLTMEPCT